MPELIVDLHIHSHYSRATSKNCDLEGLYRWGKLKGITIIGTGDFTHPDWFAELRDKLEPAEGGLYRLKPELADEIDKSLPATVRGNIIGSLIRFDERGLHAYLQHVDELFAGNFYDPAADAVTLTTIHAAKGLELNHVFLIAAEEGTLPHQRPHGESDIDEERRLFYVAVSRARARLDIVHARARAGKPAEISRFIRDIDATTLPRAQDENMTAQKRRLAKRAAKRSQGTLFDL